MGALFRVLVRWSYISYIVKGNFLTGDNVRMFLILIVKNIKTMCETPKVLCVKPRPFVCKTPNVRV